MALATTATPDISASSARADWPFLAAAALAAAVLIALVLLDGQPASAVLILGGFGLGIAFLKAEFSFTASWRRFLVRGDAGGLIGALILIAIAAMVIVPVAALIPGFGGAIAPLGPSLVIGAFVFGIGMQLANGCGSGTLYTAVIIAIARRRGASFMPSRAILIGGVLIGLLCIAVFLAGRHPWSVTFGFTVWGAKIASALGIDLSGAAFWQWPGPKRALGESILSDTSSLTDLGMILGAMAAAAATRPFARAAWPPLPSLIAAAIGGLLMGWGARLGFGCNIGAFVGGVASGSLHGWVWFAAALAGCMIGIRLRPLFGLSRE
jgi:hypothetical protein